MKKFSKKELEIFASLTWWFYKKKGGGKENLLLEYPIFSEENLKSC